MLYAVLTAVSEGVSDCCLTSTHEIIKYKIKKCIFAGKRLTKCVTTYIIRNGIF